MLVIEAPNKAEFGTVLQTWTECSYEKDLFTPSDTFSFKLAITGTSGPNAPTEDYIRQMMALTVPDTVVKVVVGTDTLMTGIIGTQRISGDRTGEYVEVSGRDPASLLTDNEVDPKLKITRNTTLPDLADQILQRYRGKGIPLRVFSDDRDQRTAYLEQLAAHRPQVIVGAMWDDKQFYGIDPDQLDVSFNGVMVCRGGQIGDDRADPGDRHVRVQAQHLFQRLEHTKLHQHQRDRDIEHHPDHSARMAVGDAGKEVRPGQRTGVGVGDIDLQLAQHHQQGHRGERDGRIRMFRPAR